MNKVDDQRVELQIASQFSIYLKKTKLSHCQGASEQKHLLFLQLFVHCETVIKNSSNKYRRWNFGSYKLIKNSLIDEACELSLESNSIGLLYTLDIPGHLIRHRIFSLLDSLNKLCVFINFVLKFTSAKNYNWFYKVTSIKQKKLKNHSSENANLSTKKFNILINLIVFRMRGNVMLSTFQEKLSKFQCAKFSRVVL